LAHSFPADRRETLPNSELATGERSCLPGGFEGAPGLIVKLFFRMGSDSLRRTDIQSRANLPIGFTCRQPEHVACLNCNKENQQIGAAKDALARNPARKNICRGGEGEKGQQAKNIKIKAEVDAGGAGDEKQHVSTA